MFVQNGVPNPLASRDGITAVAVPGAVAGYLGMHDKPLVMLDPHGHYDGLLAWLHTLVDTGYVQQAALDRLVVARDVDQAIAACAPGHIAD